MPRDFVVLHGSVLLANFIDVLRVVKVDDALRALDVTLLHAHAHWRDAGDMLGIGEFDLDGPF